MTNINLPVFIATQTAVQRAGANNGAIQLSDTWEKAALLIVIVAAVGVVSIWLSKK